MCDKKFETAGFKIVVMGKKHLKDILETERLSFALPWSEKMFEGEIENENAHYFAAVDELGKAVGYGGFWSVCGDGQITNIAVHPAYRKKHIAENILKTIIKTAEKLKTESLTLEVRFSNEAARNLYKKFGFTDVGIRKKYYRDNDEDAYLMLKEIKVE